MSRQASATGTGVIALRLNGASWDEIAEVSGLASGQVAESLYWRALRAGVSDADKEVLRAEAHEQLRRLLASVWPKATTQSDPEHLVAVSKAQGIIDRIIRLRGLDEPQEVIVHNPSAIEIEQWISARVAEITDLPDVVEAEVVPDAEAVA